MPAPTSQGASFASLTAKASHDESHRGRGESMTDTAVDSPAAPSPAVHSPVVTAHKESRAADVQLRIADAITSFAGSMNFVYIHAAIFAVWMLLIERNPWPKLTLIVSLEAIFLLTFVMIGQNRQAAFQQAKADRDFIEQEQELKTNTDVTNAIHELTKEIHARVTSAG